MDKNITVTEIADVIKKDMIDYVGPIFQDLKGDIRDLRTELTDKIDRQGEILTEKIDRQGEILTEKINRQGEILTEKINRQGEILTEKINRQGEILTDKINWQGTIMEDMRREVKLALELSGTSFQNEIAMKDHEARISAVEGDIKVLKVVKLSD